MERFVKIVNSWTLLTIFVELSILDVWQRSEYAYVWRLKCYANFRKQSGFLILFKAALCQHLFVQSQQKIYQSYAWNMFQANIKDTRMTSQRQ